MSKGKPSLNVVSLYSEPQYDGWGSTPQTMVARDNRSRASPTTKVPKPRRYKHKYRDANRRPGLPAVFKKEKLEMAHQSLFQPIERPESPDHEQMKRYVKLLQKMEEEQMKDQEWRMISQYQQPEYHEPDLDEPKLTDTDRAQIAGRTAGIYGMPSGHYHRGIRHRSPPRARNISPAKESNGEWDLRAKAEPIPEYDYYNDPYAVASRRLQEERKAAMKLNQQQKKERAHMLESMAHRLSPSFGRVNRQSYKSPKKSSSLPSLHGNKKRRGKGKRKLRFHPLKPRYMYSYLCGGNVENWRRIAQSGDHAKSAEYTTELKDNKEQSMHMPPPPPPIEHNSQHPRSAHLPHRSSAQKDSRIATAPSQYNSIAQSDHAGQKDPDVFIPKPRSGLSQSKQRRHNRNASLSRSPKVRDRKSKSTSNTRDRGSPSRSPLRRRTRSSSSKSPTGNRLQPLKHSHERAYHQQDRSTDDTANQASNQVGFPAGGRVAGPPFLPPPLPGSNPTNVDNQINDRVDQHVHGKQDNQVKYNFNQSRESKAKLAKLTCPNNITGRHVYPSKAGRGCVHCGFRLEQKERAELTCPASMGKVHDYTNGICRYCLRPPSANAVSVGQLGSTNTSSSFDKRVPHDSTKGQKSTGSTSNVSDVSASMTRTSSAESGPTSGDQKPKMATIPEL